MLKIIFFVSLLTQSIWAQEASTVSNTNTELTSNAYLVDEEELKTQKELVEPLKTVNINAINKKIYDQILNETGSNNSQKESSN